VLPGQRGGSHTAVNLSFLDRGRYFSFRYLLIYPHEVELTPFHTHCYLENLVAPGMEPGTSVSAARNCDHETTKVVTQKITPVRNTTSRTFGLHLAPSSTCVPHSGSGNKRLDGVGALAYANVRA
jgi:hypothetical protein